jgi:Ca2+-binding RTX toxin-like protein
LCWISFRATGRIDNFGDKLLSQEFLFNLNDTLSYPRCNPYQQHRSMLHSQIKNKILFTQIALLLSLFWPSIQADETEGNIQSKDTREYNFNFDERSYAPVNPNIASEALQTMAVALLRGADADEIRRLWTHSHPERLLFWQTLQSLSADDSTKTLVLPAQESLSMPSHLQTHTWTHAIAIASNRPVGTILSNAQGHVLFVQGHDHTSKIFQVGDIPGVTKINLHWLIGYGNKGLTANLTQMGVTSAIGTEHSDVLIGGGRGTVLIHAGKGNDIVIGGAANDVLYGGDGVDLIDGGAGNDYLVGGAGNDRLLGGLGDDVLIGGAGDDDLTGGAGNDVLIGGEGNDRIVGGAGIDLAVFHRGLAQYRVTHIGKEHWQVAHLPYEEKELDGVDELFSVERLSFRDMSHVKITADDAPIPVNEDIDLLRLEQVPGAGPQGQTAWRLPAHLLTANDISPTGLPLRLNEVVSMQRAPYPRKTWLKIDIGEILHEASGAILISPLLPHAGRTNIIQIRYTIRDDSGQRGATIIDRSTQTNREAIGTARIFVRHASSTTPVRNCFVDCVLAHDQTIAQLVGDKALRIYGTAHADEIRGNAKDNVLDGGGSADVMIGRQGNDLYFVDDENDQVIEEANEGTDTVNSKARSYKLPANVENLRLLPGAKIGIGNDLDNQLIANDTGVTLIGLAGKDALFGGDGDDTLDGGVGDDYLSGGNGNDAYVWAPNEGNDFMLIGPNAGFQSRQPDTEKQETISVIRLRDGVDKADLLFERTGTRFENLIIRSKTMPGSLTVLSWFENPTRRAAHIENHQRDVLFTRTQIEQQSSQ